MGLNEMQYLNHSLPPPKRSRNASHELSAVNEAVNETELFNTAQFLE
jgi:hypothetical protein